MVRVLKVELKGSGPGYLIFMALFGQSGLNQTVQPGLDTSTCFSVVPVCTYMPRSEFLRNETLIQ